jgi:hypothetical protein
MKGSKKATGQVGQLQEEIGGDVHDSSMMRANGARGKGERARNVMAWNAMKSEWGPRHGSQRQIQWAGA